MPYLITNPHDEPSYRRCLIIHQLPGPLAITADEHRIADAGTEAIDNQGRIAIVLPCYAQWLNDEQPPPLHAGVLGTAHCGSHHFGLLH